MLSLDEPFQLIGWRTGPVNPDQLADCTGSVNPIPMSAGGINSGFLRMLAVRASRSRTGTGLRQESSPADSVSDE